MTGRVFVKRIYDAPAEADGQRVLVDRLWPRGVAREAAALMLWLKDIAPTTALRQWFGHEPRHWDDFCKRYHAELAQNPVAVSELRALIARGDVTLLYAARDAQHNHALVLADYLAQADEA